MIMRSTDRRVRDVPFLVNLNVTALDKRKLGLHHIMLCHDLRRFSTCFTFPGCSDQYAAKIASVQYHMVFGKRLPIQAFLAYLGHGKQMCEQSCSADALNSCRRGLREISETEESNLMREAATISERISQSDDAEGTCNKFRNILTELMRVRSEYCGEAAKCLCMEEQLHKGISYCNAGCEHLIKESVTGVSPSTHPLSLLSLLLIPSLLLP